MILGAAVLLALSDGQWTALGAVIVASIAAVASITTALISLATKKSTEEKIGTPNGQGNLVQMLESSLRGQALLLEGQTGQDERLAVIEARQIRQAERLSAIEDTQQTFCASVHGLEVAVTASE